MVSQSKVDFMKLTRETAAAETGDVLKEETGPLPATMRRTRMLQLIAEREFVRVSDLAELFGISDVTVRADLASLERTHSVRRIRGGVMAPAGGIPTEPSFEESMGEFSAEKQHIGEYAAGLVQSGMSVLLDVGTTTTAIARALVARTDLEQVTVVTNGLNVALELEPGIGRLTVVVTGGTLRRLQHSLVDPLAGTLLEQLHADLAFVGCNGVDAEHGVTNLNLPEAQVKQRMIRSAARAVVVADGSKLGQVHLGRVAAVGEVAGLLTGASAPAHEISRLRRAGLDVTRVE